MKPQEQVWEFYTNQAREIQQRIQKGLRAYKQTQVRLLFWSGLCFTGLALNNVLLLIDLELVPDTDLFLLRSLPALIGVLLLIYGLIWDAD